MPDTISAINKLKPKIVGIVKKKLASLPSNKKKRNYRVAWHSFEKEVQKEIVRFLKQHFRDTKIQHLKKSKIFLPKTKSRYPDIEIKNSEGVFAIDIKCNENTKDPWFDMGRLDTIIEKRLNKFVEEWELIIKYETNTGKFIKAYFILFREAVGLRKECNGVSYRPYDGKLRPKLWDEFNKNISHWKTKDKYLIGIKKSLKFRWKKNIKAHLIPKLNASEKKAYVKLFTK